MCCVVCACRACVCCVCWCVDVSERAVCVLCVERESVCVCGCVDR